ncbi:MAG: ketoacyl-ACP synthase III [Gammaproteobacteria bacterium]|nr:MAG: ketoacyl-ACP synthase III [Gammaproteobacteria bacterium]
MIYSKISGTGAYLPEKILTNADLEKIVNTNDQWVRERTGIEQRHISADDELCSDLGSKAAQQAIDNAGISVADIELIVVATSTPDRMFPSTACIIQSKLGAKCPAFDITAACSGFVYALSIADNYVRAGVAKNVLIIGAETYSRILNWKDRNTCVLFGDGAGAVVLKASDEPGVMSVNIGADGDHQDLLGIPWGVSQGYDALTEGSKWFDMKGNEVFKHAVKTMSAIALEVLQENGFDPHATDYWLIPHQANIRILKSTAKKMKLDQSKVIVSVDKHANTSAASIPLAMHGALETGKIKSGDLAVLEAFGGGLTWGAALVRL